MKIFFTFAIGLSFFLAPAHFSFAAENGMIFSGAYQTSDGLLIKRWMVRERGNGTVKVTVIDEPNLPEAKIQAVVSQSVVAQLSKPTAQMLSYYSHFQDYKTHKKSLKDFENLNHNMDAEPLWVADHEWSEADEADYAQFIEQNHSVNYFVGGGVLLDCADTAVAWRWIYARSKRLPVANHLIGSGKLFGHFSQNAEWDVLTRDDDWKKDERFKAALRYVLANTYTYSVAYDLYPVAINKANIRAGTVHLALHSADTGHTETIFAIGASLCYGGPCIKTIWGNEPSRENVFESALNMERSYKRGLDGFLRWVWPVQKNGEWDTIAREAMPGYSLEQYDIVGSPSYYVMVALGVPMSIATEVRSKFGSIIQMIEYRRGVVNDAIVHCVNQSCPLGSAAYESYSTPSRDGRLKAAIAEWFEKVKQMPNPIETINGYMASATDYTSVYGALVESPRLVTHQDVIFNQNHVLDNMSYDPNDTLESRWGCLRVRYRRHCAYIP